MSGPPPLARRRAPQACTDLLLQNLEAIAADMARHNVRFASTPPTDDVDEGPNHVQAAPTGRPSTGQLRHHLSEVQHRIHEAVEGHFPMGNTFTLTSTVRAQLLASPRGAVLPPLYSSIVHQARLFSHDDGSGDNSPRAELHRLPFVAPPSGLTPMTINTYNPSPPTQTKGPPLLGTSTQPMAGNQPLSARVGRAILDGNTSSTTLRELTLIADRGRRSPRTASISAKPNRAPSASRLALPPPAYTTPRPPPSNNGAPKASALVRRTARPRATDEELSASLDALQNALRVVPTVNLHAAVEG